MSFELIDDIELRTDYYVATRIRVLKVEAELLQHGDQAVISALMASPFHLLQGEEYPEGFTTNWTWERDGKMVTEELHHVKVFGHYDLGKLSVSDYRLLDKAEMEDIFNRFVEEKTFGDSDYLRDIRSHVDPLLSETAALYLLDLSPEDHPEKVSDVLNVFSFFMAFLAIDHSKQQVILVEFGQD